MARTLVRTITNKPDSLQTLELTSTTVITLPSGSFVNVGGISKDINTNLTIDTSIIGVNGLESTILADTFYYIYLVLDSGEPKLIGSTNSSQPSGFEYYTKIGNFYSNSTSEVVQLVDGGQLPPIRYVVAQSNTGNAFWQVYSDGWVRQGGFRSGGSQTIPLLISMTTTGYTVSVTKNNLSTAAERPDWGVTSRSTTGFFVDRGVGGGDGWHWFAEGPGDVNSIKAKGVYLDI